MRQRQLRFASVNRIILLLYVPLSILLAIYYIFMSDLPRAALALGTLLFLAAPLLFHACHLRTGQLLLFCYFLLLIFAYSGGLVLQLGHRFVVYNIFVHVSGGFAVCLLAAAAFCCLTKQRTLHKTLCFCNLFCVCLALANGFIWELVHFAAVYMVHQSPVTLFALVLDFIMILLGASLFCVMTALNEYKGVHTSPLYVFEDFAALNVKSSVQILPPE